MHKKFGEKLKEFRLEKNYTQEELAGVLFVSKKTVSKWETGRGMPDPTLLPLIARALGVKIDDLFGDKAEAESFYRSYHNEVDEYALYVDCYKKQRTVTTVWKCICAAVCVVAVVFGAFFLKYYNGYQSLLLHAERILYWKDYSKADSEWQSYRIDNEFEYHIEAEENASVLVALQERVYRADGSLLERKTFNTERHLLYVDNKQYSLAQGLPSEYFLEGIPELDKKSNTLGPAVEYCQSSGVHHLQYRHTGSDYFGELYLRVHIPESNRESIGLKLETDTGESISGQSKSGPFTLYSEPERVLHGTKLASLSFYTQTKEPDLVIENPINLCFSKESQAEVAEKFGGGRVVIVYQTYYGEWRKWSHNTLDDYVCKVRVEFIGSDKYLNVFFEFDFCMTG